MRYLIFVIFCMVLFLGGCDKNSGNSEVSSVSSNKPAFNTGHFESGSKIDYSISGKDIKEIKDLLDQVLND